MGILNRTVIAENMLDSNLEREQALVDLGALHPRLAVRADRVGRALVAREIDQRELAVQLLVLAAPQHYLEHRVRPRRRCVRRRLPRRPTSYDI